MTCERQYTAEAIAEMQQIATECNKGKVYIYTLSDPDTQKVAYVGQTINPKSRFWEHKQTIGTTKKDMWVLQLRLAGKAPEMTVIDFCEPDNAVEVEREWIEYYLAVNCKLVNTVMVGVPYLTHLPILARIASADCVKCYLCNNPSPLKGTRVYHDRVCNKWKWYCPACIEEIKSRPIERDDWDW